MISFFLSFLFGNVLKKRKNCRKLTGKRKKKKKKFVSRTASNWKQNGKAGSDTTREKNIQGKIETARDMRANRFRRNYKRHRPGDRGRKGSGR